MFSASFMAFSHGSNDGQKFIGAFALALYLGGVFPNFHIPYWVIVLCAFTMGAGTMIGGFRIIKTMGLKIIRLETYQGFSAETSAAVTIQTASAFGIPLSTTHTIGTSIVGVGVAKNPKAVSWQIVLNVVYAWLLTFPICGLLSFIVAWAFNWIFK
jgi:PiT family inorganic phosphate transporter